MNESHREDALSAIEGWVEHDSTEKLRHAIDTSYLVFMDEDPSQITLITDWVVDQTEEDPHFGTKKFNLVDIFKEWALDHSGSLEAFDAFSREIRELFLRKS